MILNWQPSFRLVLLWLPDWLIFNGQHIAIEARLAPFNKRTHTRRGSHESISLPQRNAQLICLIFLLCTFFRTVSFHVFAIYNNRIKVLARCRNNATAARPAWDVHQSVAALVVINISASTETGCLIIAISAAERTPPPGVQSACDVKVLTVGKSGSN